MSEIAMIVDGRTYAATVLEQTGHPNTCTGCCFFVKPRGCASPDVEIAKCKSIYKLELRDER